MGFLANLQNSCTPPDLNIWICFTCYLFSTQFHHAVFLLALLSSSRSICSADGASNMSHIMLLVMTKEIFWLAVAHSYHIILVILGQAVPCTEIITKWFFSLLAIVIAMDMSCSRGKKVREMCNCPSLCHKVSINQSKATSLPISFSKCRSGMPRY